MTSRANTPVMTSERRQMREMLSVGLSRHGIAKQLNRGPGTVRYHLKDHTGHLPYRNALRCPERNALRVERLFAACNAALAARPHHQGSPT